MNSLPAASINRCVFGQQDAGSLLASSLHDRHHGDVFPLCFCICTCLAVLPLELTHRWALQGQYASEEDFKALDARLAESEASLPRADRLFYLSIPPNIFTVVAASASVSCSSKCVVNH